MELLLEALWVLVRVIWQDTGDRPWHASGCNVASLGCGLLVIVLGTYLILFALLSGS